MQIFKLRPHHMASLVNGYADSYSFHAKGLRGDYYLVDGVKHRKYTDRDVVASKLLYLAIASDPDARVIIVNGIDDVCRQCGNCDGGICTVNKVENLAFEDKRTLRERFPNLKPGDIVTVADLIPPRQYSLQNPPVLPAPQQ